MIDVNKLAFFGNRSAKEFFIDTQNGIIPNTVQEQILLAHVMLAIKSGKDPESVRDNMIKSGLCKQLDID